MCGIAFICHRQGEPAQHVVIERMARALNHRGPDAQRSVVRDEAALGHTRLSIVDIDGGQQPMLCESGRYAISFNGEIYNYRELRAELEGRGIRFRSRSDTEVVLRLYETLGADCVDKLRGMFAFAIHDQHAHSLFCARDRLGIKPLFYFWNGASLYGASEIKGIFASHALQPEFDEHSLINYFSYQFSVPPHTPFKHILELPPGHTLTLCDGQLKTRQYWDLEFPRDGEYASMDESDWLERFAQALHNAAESHTIGDVSIGAYLSGGIDSAATTCLLKEHYAAQVETFTIAFDNEKLDESPIAADIAAHLGLPQHLLRLNDGRAQGFLGELESAVYHLEQPQRLAVDIPHFMLSALVHDHRYKVVYTGDGADEILAGYDCYRQDQIRVWGNLQKNQKQRRRFYLREFADDFAPDHMRLLAQLHRRGWQHRVERKFGCYPAWYDFWQIPAQDAPTLFSEKLIEAARNNRQMEDLAETLRPKLTRWHPLNQSLYWETKTRLPGWILWKSDRLSMAHGVEARVPFMDHPLVELAAQLPPHLKLNGMDEKYILRKLMMPKLPEHPVAFKKRGFYTPIREWFFSAERSEQLAPYFSVEALRRSGIFDPYAVNRTLHELINTPSPQNADESYRIMKLEWLLMTALTCQILHHQFIDKTAPCFSN